MQRKGIFIKYSAFHFIRIYHAATFVFTFNLILATLINYYY